MSIGSFNGTVALVFASFISKVFGAIYRIPLSNLLGAEGMGLYQMAFPIYSFFLTFITGGVSSTLSRRISICRAKGNNEQIKMNFIIGKRVSLFYGIIVSIVLLLLAYPISYLQGNTDALLGYFAIMLGFVFATLLGVYRGYYQGHENMYPTAISQMLEQSLKLLIGLTLAWVLSKKSVTLGVVGALLGVSISEIISFLYFLIKNKVSYKTKVRINKGHYINFIKDCLPVSASYGILPLSTLIDSFLVINLLCISGFSKMFATSLFGVEMGMVLPLINIPNIIISALAITYLPTLCFKLEKKNNISRDISNAFRVVLLLILPCCVGVYIMASPIISILYSGLNLTMHNIATKLLQFSVFEMFFMCFVTISNCCLISINRTKTPMFSMGLGVIIKTILTSVLVPNLNINILGLVVASVCGYSITCIINIGVLKNNVPFRLSAKNIISTIASVVVMAGFLIAYNAFLKGSTFVTFVTGVMMAIIIYFGIEMVFGELKIKDLKIWLQKGG